MVIRLTVENFRSFKEETVLDFVSNSHIRFNDRHRHRFGRMSVVKNVGIFGANASGKTTAIDAICVLKDFVVKGELPDNLSFKGQEKNPTRFDIAFEREGRFFEYGFSVKFDSSIHRHIVVHEELHELFLHGKSALHYDDKHGIYDPDSPELSAFEKGYRNTVGQLFLTYIVAPERKIEGSKTSEFFSFVYSYFVHNVFVCMDKSEMLLFIDRQSIELIGSRLHDYDTGIEKVDFIEPTPSEASKLFEDPFIRGHIIASLYQSPKEDNDLYYCDGDDVYAFTKSHKGVEVRKLEFKHTGIEEPFSYRDESEGTKTIFLLISTLLCRDGVDRSFFVDNIERNIHSNVMGRFIEDFQASNRTGKSQLVFSSHLGSLMDSVLKRDEIYFAEKDDFGVSHLISLQEFATANRRESVEQKYYEGRYGALPRLGVRVDFDDPN